MRRPAPQPSVTTVHMPAPVGGLNTVDAGTTVPDGDCIQCFNLISAEHGLRARFGYRTWCDGLTGTETNTVVSMLSFVGSTANGNQDRLFAITSSGIWDVTTATPSQSIVFANTGGDAGHGVSHSFTTGGGHFLVYCDEANGYYIYSESTGAWAQVTEGVGAGQVSGVNPANFVSVTVWKSRLWFVEKNTAKAWYLDAGSVFGAANMLNLDRSAQFRQGGDLVGLWNWTLDGGIGIDDNLVALSRGGDVAVYQGTDPASASTFALKGTWNAGAFPAGRRVASIIGGDLLLLTKSGVRPLSQLVAGEDGINTYTTGKIANLFNELMLTRSELSGWAIHNHPEDNSIIITVPTIQGSSTEQLVQALWNRSWSRYRDLPMVSACVWGKKLYFGDTDGAIHVNDGYTDGEELTPVQWSLLFPFRDGDSRKKQAQMIRALVISDSSTQDTKVEARYGYDLSEIEEVELLDPPADYSLGVWDVAQWDTATWRSQPFTSLKVRGVVGMGSDMSIAVRGTSTSRTVFVSVDVVLSEGGIL